MRSVRGLVALATLLMTAVFASPMASATPPLKVLLSDLSSPKGVATTASGDPVVAQGAFGPPGPVLVYFLRGPDRGSTFEATDPINLIDVAISPLDGTGWGIGPDGEGDGVLYHQLADGTVVTVLNIADYQQGDPDPVDQADFPEESNLYGLAVSRDGDALVADAAGNDLIRVSPDGDATTVARFDLETVSPGQTAEAVPTSVAIGKHGAIYVGELKGAPFLPGTSHVWRIDPDADEAFCSTNDPEPDCTVAASGFTAIQDIAINRKNGTLYVYELAADGVPAFEAGFESGDFPPAVLLKVKKKRRTELVAGRLSQPGGVAVSRNGTVFVTDNVFTDQAGRLLRLRR